MISSSMSLPLNCSRSYLSNSTHVSQPRDRNSKFDGSSIPRDLRLSICDRKYSRSGGFYFADMRARNYIFSLGNIIDICEYILRMYVCAGSQIYALLPSRCRIMRGKRFNPRNLSPLRLHFFLAIFTTTRKIYRRG